MLIRDMSTDYELIADMSTAQPEARARKQTQHGGQATPEAPDHHLPVQAEHQVVSEPAERDLGAQEGRLALHPLHLSRGETHS